MRVLFSNAPWYKLPENNQPGWVGVKAGSRWPHTRPYYGGSLVSPYLTFPFFLATAGALAKRNGFEAIVRDSITMGESYEEFYRFVAAYNPDVVVMETCTPSLSSDLTIAEQLKILLPEAIIVFTGIHFDLQQESFLENNPVVDYAVYSEYEVPVNQLLQALAAKSSLQDVGNLVYRNDGIIVKNPCGALADLNELPWPERDDLPWQNYIDPGCYLDKPQLHITTTRGCPFGCIFCVWPQVMYGGRTYRTRNPADVVDEIAANMEKHEYKSIYIDDDTFNVSAKHVLQFARLMKERKLDHIPWSMMARADLMTEEILVELKSAGLYSLKYGVESADHNVLKDIGKQLDLQRVAEMIRFTKKIGIKVHLTFTIGLPSDTKDSIDKTIDFACDMPADSVQVSIATPFPGTKMFELYDDKGWITSKDWDAYNGAKKAVSRTELLTSEQLEEYVQLAHRRWRESIILRLANSEEFRSAFRTKLLAEVKPNLSILVLQSATYGLTRELVKLLKDMQYDIHMILHERFIDKFSDLLPVERIHSFSNVGNFQYEELQDFAKELASAYSFAGAIVPYSNPSGKGYEEVEKIAVLAGGRIIAGIGNDGTIVK